MLAGAFLEQFTAATFFAKTGTSDQKHFYIMRAGSFLKQFTAAKYFFSLFFLATGFILQPKHSKWP